MLRYDIKYEIDMRKSSRIKGTSYALRYRWRITINLWTTSTRICLRDNDRPLHNGETSFCSYNVRAMALMNGHVRVYAFARKHEFNHSRYLLNYFTLLTFNPQILHHPTHYARLYFPTKYPFIKFLLLFSNIIIK